MLLVITNKTDIASDYLILRLKERDISFRRLNTEDLGRSFGVDIFISSSGPSFQLTFPDGLSLTEPAVAAVYFRQPMVPAFGSDLVGPDLEFAKREATELLRSLWRLIPREKWLNHPRDLWLASNKIEQLASALRIGFQIPATCVSSNEDTIRDFFRKCQGRAICKAVRHGFLRGPDAVLVATTQRIDNKFLETFHNYTPVPMIYQEEIPKALDVRVTVVGDKAFATAIHSQQFAETSVDWRLWDVHELDLKHEKISLPSDVERMCMRITQHFNLRFSAIDLVLAVDGSYYFLEMNPNGQWAWIERKAGHPIRDEIIRAMGLHDG